ncbi:L-rhamnose mutarotase [Maribellus luteus]|uniref:L-rhamnose mutarotase n=1 Tax=Maribellus luteus TaxID=2305463 RepID=A0A399ST91_9BACT|nr:L-rhamnose mutarotase [Maribellus luteus]RIJ45742.1 L-rhamnose mutarotase [Maribellus luteus]
MKFKRYCKTLLLENDPSLIEAYREVHKPENTWSEITQGMKEVGILDMEIYIIQNRLFMIMDTVPDFDHEQAMQELAQKPHQAEWEAYVSRFQLTTSEATAGEKWVLMDRIYELNQQQTCLPIDGQPKQID